MRVLFPLLLTVLALVHRTGVRLPDHRAELYEHVTRILVERWNQVRSLSRQEVALPLKATDAVRLLGPVALEVIRGGNRGALPESVLRERLQRSIASGNLRGLESADKALELFRTTLGLLVEQGPGLYSFLHLTLAEYFAAWELVRSNELERLTQDAQRAFKAEWREVLLLAAGVLGIVRGDDIRLETFIDDLLRSSEQLLDKPPATVPSLLSGILADDPALSADSADKIIHALVTKWWFLLDYDAISMGQVLLEVMSLGLRLKSGRFAGKIQELLQRCCNERLHPIFQRLCDADSR